MKNLPGQGVHGINVNGFQNNLFRFQVQQKLHVVGECQQLSLPTDIEVAKLDDMLKVTCSVIKLRKVAISFSQQIFNEKNELLFELECDVAFINMKTGLPKAMPSEAYQYAQGFLTQKS